MFPHRGGVRDLVAGQQHDGTLVPRLTRPLTHHVAVQPWHAAVHEHQGVIARARARARVRVRVSHELKRVLPIGGGVVCDAHLGTHARHHLQDQGTVVHEQDSGGCSAGFARLGPRRKVLAAWLVAHRALDRGGAFG